MDLTSDIIKLCENNMKPLVVLDDDPTGTQTVHDIDVLTEWYASYIYNDVFCWKIYCFYKVI